MKTLYESLLDVDKNYDNDILISLLFSKNLQQRHKAFDELLSIIESYHPKRLKTISGMKNSYSYFIQFTKPVKIENGEIIGIHDWISNIHICSKNRIGSYYKTVDIDASNDKYDESLRCVIYDMKWDYTKS